MNFLDDDYGGDDQDPDKKRVTLKGKKGKKIIKKKIMWNKLENKLGYFFVNEIHIVL